MKIDWNAPAIVEKIRRGALRGVQEGIGLVEARAVFLITQTTKTGRVYRYRGVKHQSSAPGQPFANRSGNTLNRRDIKIDAARLRATLFFNSVNAARMEYGTRKMAPRPFARRALAETRQQVEDVIYNAILEELRTT